ncbi:MAG TPA: hypothetical protein VHB54_08515 [Mucilaginibacter sp.]|nr:hypothetical protein [Mucilaginibacter sp.]HVW13850.1 hypothetical protein [Mucilaginibacter sp.]
METLQIDILNPKAVKLLKDLADLELISIRNSSDDELLNIINKLRDKADQNRPGFDEISKEVEQVRKNRYARSKR